MKFTEKYRETIIAFGILLIFIVIAFGILAYSFRSVQYRPYDGIWYCEKLSLHLSFDAGKNSYLTVNDEKEICVWSHKHRSKFLRVFKVDEESRLNYDKLYSDENMIFELEYMSLSESTFAVCDENGNKYTFVRVS